MTQEILELNELTKDSKHLLMKLESFDEIKKIAFFSIEGNSGVFYGIFERLDEYYTKNLVASHFNIKFFKNNKDIYVVNIGVIKDYCEAEGYDEKQKNIRNHRSRY